MEKIYILCVGEYSDMYVHDKACLSMEDASILCEELQAEDRWGSIRIEELEIYSPQGKVKNIIPDILSVYVRADYSNSGVCCDHFISINREPCFTIKPISFFDINKNRISFYMFIKDPLAKTLRSFEENMEKIIKRTHKIAWDKLAKIQSLLCLEGWTKEMIETTINNTTLAFDFIEEERINEAK